MVRYRPPAEVIGYCLESVQVAVNILCTAVSAKRLVAITRIQGINNFFFTYNAYKYTYICVCAL